MSGASRRLTYTAAGIGPLAYIHGRISWVNGHPFCKGAGDLFCNARNGAGKAKSPQAISFTVYEYQFPRIEDAIGNTHLTGRTTPLPVSGAEVHHTNPRPTSAPVTWPEPGKWPGESDRRATMKCKSPARAGLFEMWCGREDSNLQGIAPTSS